MSEDSDRQGIPCIAPAIKGCDGPKNIKYIKNLKIEDICRNPCIWVLLYAYELSTFDAGFVGGAVCG
jgi:hypothetical protein